MLWFQEVNVNFGFLYDEDCFYFSLWSVVAERSSALDSSCQNVGSNPGLAGRGACVLEQDT